MDWVVAPQLELAAYHHRRPAAAKKTASAAAADTTSADAADSGTSKHARHKRHGATAAETDDATNTAPVHAAAADTPYQTVIKPGETLGEVAERVHSSKAALTALNDLKHPKHVKPGTVLKIPYRYNYEVQKGDTLYTIAHRFNQQPEQIAKLNGLKAVPTLQPGQAIQLPPDAADQGKRDHAAAAGPEPVAAPDKVADAALRKAEKVDRKSRRSRAAELNGEEAALPPQEIRPTRRKVQTAAAASSQADASPTAVPPPVTPTESPPSRPAAVATAPVEAPRPYAPPAASPRTYAANPPSTPRAYAVTPPSTPYAPSRQTSAATALAASGGATSAYRSSTPASSTSVAPGYTARSAVTSPSVGQVASVTPPRYTPGYPATGSATVSPYTPSLGRERPTAPALSGGAATASDIVAAARGRFIWPLRGTVISGFGAKGTGEYNNGMDISAQPGTGVRAAASGDVVYAGSSIPGYGDMVLIKHPGGWVTAYAHLNRIEVRMHDTVSQGDEIGQAGQTGVVDRPELYFEVRYGATAADRPRPVDPALVLPPGGG